MCRTVLNARRKLLCAVLFYMIDAGLAKKKVHSHVLGTELSFADIRIWNSNPPDPGALDLEGDGRYRDEFKACYAKFLSYPIEIQEQAKVLNDEVLGQWACLTDVYRKDQNRKVVFDHYYNHITINETREYDDADLPVGFVHVSCLDNLCPSEPDVIRMLDDALYCDDKDAVVLLSDQTWYSAPSRVIGHAVQSDGKLDLKGLLQTEYTRDMEECSCMADRDVIKYLRFTLQYGKTHEFMDAVAQNYKHAIVDAWKVQRDAAELIDAMNDDGYLDDEPAEDSEYLFGVTDEEPPRECE